jgi:uncharacterized membrane protein YesL
MGDRRTAASADGWAIRAYHACDLLCFVAALNLLWVGGTLLGGVLLGAAPATVAAHTLARRRLRGETVPAVREFWRVWRAEFGRANVLLLPVGLVGGLLWLNWLYFGALGGAIPLAAAFTLAWYAVLVPLYAHYDLPLTAYAGTASRFVLANPGPAALLLVLAAGIAAVTAAVPGLLPFLAVGAWVHLDTALCLSFFHRNDERVTTEQRGSR